MNFKMKTLAVAAIAAMAMSGAANARIQDASGTAGSEFVFSAWDSSAGVGYTFDLNWTATLNTLFGSDTAYTTAANATVANSLADVSGVIYDSVLSGMNFADVSNVQWNLAAADSVGRNRMMVTLGDSATDLVTQNAKIKNAVTSFSANYVSPVNSKGTHVGADFAIDGYAVTSPTDLTAYAGAATFGNTVAGYLNDTTVLMGQSTSLWMLGMNSSTTTGTAGSNPGWLNQVKLADGREIIAKTYLANDGYHLQVAAVSAVPEADTWAMLLAGLGLMGFIARRRTQA